MPEDVKVNESGQPSVNSTFSITDYVRGIMSHYAFTAIWVAATAVLTFIITQYFGLSTLVHEMSGKQQQTDETIKMILQERNDLFASMLQQQNQLMIDNQQLRERLNKQK